MAKLTTRQCTLLNEYLLEKKELLKSTPSLTTSDITSWVREALKFDVDTTNITHRVGPEGALYHHEWPGSAQSRAGRLTSKLVVNKMAEQIEFLRVFAHHLVHQLADAGVIVTPPGTVQEWKELKDQVKADLADTDLREPEER